MTHEAQGAARAQPAPTLVGEHVVLGPLHAADAEVLRAIAATPKVARWWDVSDEPGWPLDDDSDARRFAVREKGGDAVIGLAQYGEETDPQYRSAGIDLMLDPRVHGHGLGADVVRTIARHLFDDLGHHRITIDPAAANAAAIRCYEKVGFRRVGVMRRYERNAATGTWRDGLLMDLLPDDLT